jgi:hypothetical protein
MERGRVHIVLTCLGVPPAKRPDSFRCCDRGAVEGCVLAPRRVDAFGHRIAPKPKLLTNFDRTGFE